MNTSWELKTVGNNFWVAPKVFEELFSSWIIIQNPYDEKDSPDFIQVILGNTYYSASKECLRESYSIKKKLLQNPSEDLDDAIEGRVTKFFFHFQKLKKPFFSIYRHPICFEDPLLKTLQFLKKSSDSMDVTRAYYNRKYTFTAFRIAIIDDEIFAITRVIFWQTADKKMTFSVHLNSCRLCLSLTHPKEANLTFFNREYEVYEAIDAHPNKFTALLKPLTQFEYDCNGEIKKRIIVPWLQEDLSSYIQPLPKARRIQIAYQMIEALEQLREVGFFHGDVKLENFRIQSGQVVLIDYANCRRLNEPPLKQGGTAGHLAPEYMEAQLKRLPLETLNCEKIDDYALGVALHEVILGKEPHFSIYQLTDRKDAIQKAHEFFSEAEYNRSDFVMGAIMGLLNPDPKNRLSKKSAKYLLKLEISTRELFP